MAEASRAWIQLCGRLVVELDGDRVEAALPGPKGRALFAYLVLHRGRPVERDELLTAVWGGASASEATPALSVCLSRLRRGLGRQRIRGRSELELVLPPRTFVDVEAALEAVHRAESRIAMSEWAEAWGPSGVAYHVAERPLLPDLDLPWLDEWRRRLDDVRVRALECFAASALGLGGPALAQAEQLAARLTELAPYRESGYRLLMESLERRGNPAEALRVYERLRRLLRDELGAVPGPTVQAVHRRLLAGSTAH